MASALIEADNLVLQYAAKKAVDSISFSIHPGTTVGLLGPNGAGKSSTMRMLTGYKVPTSGSARIAGIDISVETELAQSKLGYLPEAVGGFEYLSVAEFLTYCAHCRQIDGERAKEACTEIIHRLDLQSVSVQLINQLSKGWRQRVWLAQALIHAPDVLILDEPTDGLDPIQKKLIRTLIKDIGNEASIILSTHLLEEVELVCDRAIVINEGRIVADTPVRALQDQNGSIAEAFYDLVH